MEPLSNDVLSGRGACFNHHPGNQIFRRMLLMQRAAYSTSTKKQKMMISRSIVEAIYSMDPPGRFLKKCSETEKWTELSKREAADKAAQAMAYLVRVGGSPASPQGGVGISSQRTGRPLPILHANTDFASLVAGSDQGGETGRDGNSAANDDDYSKSQQRTVPLQQFITSNTLPASTSGAPLNLNELAQIIAQTQLQQQYLHPPQQRQSLLQHPLGLQPSLPPTLTLSVPSSSAQGGLLTSDILRQLHLLRGDYGTGSQPVSLLQPANPYADSGDSSVMGRYLYLQNPSILGAAIAPQAAHQLLDQAQLGATLTNQLISVSSSILATANRLPLQQQSELLYLLRQVMALLQQNSHDPPPNNSSANITHSSGQQHEKGKKAR